MSSTISCGTEGQAKGAAAESEEKEGEGGEGGQCGAMQRLIGCSLWTHAANSNAIAVELAVGVVSLPPSLPLSPSLPTLPGHTNSRRPLTMDPKLKPRAEPESESESTRLTHTALWKLENYFHCCSGGAAGAGVAEGGSGRLWLRLVSKRHKRVLY